MNTQIEKLSAFLKEDCVPLNADFHFREDSDPNNLYELSVECLNVPVMTARRLAIFYGCEPDDAPSEISTRFTASDSWHGNGVGDLRELADELLVGIKRGLGERFLDTTHSALDIHDEAENIRTKDLMQRATESAKDAVIHAYQAGYITGHNDTEEGGYREDSRQAADVGAAAIVEAVRIHFSTLPNDKVTRLADDFILEGRSKTSPAQHAPSHGVEIR